MTIKEVEIQLALGTLSLDMKLEFAYNKRTLVEVLTILSTDESSSVRYYIADNPSTPKEILTILSTDENKYVRYRVVVNPNTHKEVLAKLR